MAYCEEHVLRIEKYFAVKELIVEKKKMMGAICFMLNNKMCCGSHIDKTSGQSFLMARVGEIEAENHLEAPHVLPMDFTGRPMKGFLFIEEIGTQSDNALTKWLDLYVKFNPEAKASKKRTNT